MEPKEAQVLPFRRPDVVVFERFDVEDMAALFRSKQGSDKYLFTLLPDGSLEEAYVQPDGEGISDVKEFTDAQLATLDRLISHATRMMKDQLATWHKLDANAKLSLLMAWAHDTVRQLEESILEAAKAGVADNADDIAVMCEDIQQCQEYIAGLEAARSLL